MAYEHIKFDKKERIAYISINRPAKFNAFNIQMHEDLAEVLGNFRNDPDLWIAIITGAGEKAFCAGNDIADFIEHPEEPLPLGGFGGITNYFECWKPIIAAVNGLALGGGLEIALACDIVIAAENARFGLPEPTVARVAAAGGVQRLPRQIPLKVAMGMILAGRRLTAQEGYQLGLVNEVVPLSGLMPAAEKWAQEIMKFAPLAVRASKEMVIKGLDLPLLASLNVLCPEYKKMEHSEDFVEGPKAFNEKRPPQWKGQ